MDSERFLLTILIQLMVIIAAARAGGWIFGKLGQPQVVGEIATGLLLGPSALGRFSPELFHHVFPSEASSVFLVMGQLGLVFLMFLVGLEFDFSHLSSLGRTAGSVALAGLVLPFTLGAAVAWWIHDDVAADFSRPGFVLFCATALSITAIPILGRIMMEFKLTHTRIGAVTISAAAVDDALGWILLAAVSASVRGNFEILPVLKMLALTIGFVVIVFCLVRPAFRAWSRRVLAKNGELALLPFSIVLLAILASAVATNTIGVFSIFGPFVLGAALSGDSVFRMAVRRHVDAFVTAFFLPVFFTYTGLRTNVGTLDSVHLWLICLLLIGAAVVGKMAGCGLAARMGGLTWRESASVAVMMNTRALMGLIAINIGRELKVIPDTVFCMMVLMAIFTTLMTAPLLRRLAIPGATPDSSSELTS